MAADRDLLEGATWECAATPPGEASSPGELAGLPLRWLPASVPGTAAGALRDAGLPEPTAAELDGRDWWFRCRFPSPLPRGEAPLVLGLEGLATVADVWLDGRHLARTESMFAPSGYRSASAARAASSVSGSPRSHPSSRSAGRGRGGSPRRSPSRTSVGSTPPSSVASPGGR